MISLILLAGSGFLAFYFIGGNEEARLTSINQNAVYEPITNSEGQVTVSVAPKNLTKGSSAWEFEVVLDTHSVELDHDLVKNSVPVDSFGNKYLPLGWEGDPPGGHHRKGVLKFQPVAGLQGQAKLEISDVGGVSKRDFIWQLE